MPLDPGLAMHQHQTTAWVCQHYPERVRTLLSQLDVEQHDLGQVKAAADRDDLPEACDALLAYYNLSASGQWLRSPAVQPTNARDAAADIILQDTFTFYLQTDTVPRTPSGGLLWSHPGPSNDWEWTLALNRHHHIRTLLDAYRKTGNADYVRAMDSHIRDWITACLPYPAARNAVPQWRGLEISFRVKRWAEVFYALMPGPNLSPATRILILTSLLEHAHHLRHFHSGNNWLTMELSALAMLAAAWPEFTDSPAWLDYATQTLTRELAGQVYPDGAQHELTSHYHRVALSNFALFAETCRGAGLPLDAAFSKTLASMVQYLAHTMRPDGHGLLNNDSNLDDNRTYLARAAEEYQRPDWLYITSHGKLGTRPTPGPSVMFPWAGQLIMRSGWDADATWAFFDVGPWGSSHQHNDKLHLSVSAFGRDLLVDSGRFTYAGDDVRFRNDYAILSRAHNVILIDDKGQSPGPKLAATPITGDHFATTPDLTYARGLCDHFDAIEGTAAHTRIAVHLSDHLIVVADRIETDRPRTIEALWHWHPRCTVAVQDHAIVSTDANAGNLRIVPLAPFAWQTHIIQGQEAPYIQGWYSPEYNQWEPNPTARCQANIPADTAFAWLLVIAQGPVPHATGRIIGNTADAIHLTIDIPGHSPRTITIPWQSGQPTVG